MPFVSLSEVKISGFAAGKEKQPHVKLLENISETHATQNLREAGDDLEGTCYSREESKPVHGRSREGGVKVSPGKASTVRTAHPADVGSLRTLIRGWLKLRAGPPGRDSVSREWEAERLLLMKVLTLPDYSKGENS